MSIGGLLMSQQSDKERAFVTSYAPAPPVVVDIRDSVDTGPSDIQPPGVDEEVDYNSLEEALMS